MVCALQTRNNIGDNNNERNNKDRSRMAMILFNVTSSQHFDFSLRWRESFLHFAAHLLIINRFNVREDAITGGLP
jgi:hypothetical protein